MKQRGELLRQAQRAQRLFISALLYTGPELEYLGLAQGLADSYCELMILRDLLANA